MVIDGHKYCPKCSTNKPVLEFYNSKSSKDKHSSYCKKCQNLRSTSYARENKDKIPTLGYTLKRRYGITTKDYEQMLIKQEFKCAICGTLKCPSGRNFAVDHDHTTKKIRGLLCSPCNTGLGQYQDSTELLQKAIKYLKENDL